MFKYKSYLPDIRLLKWVKTYWIIEKETSLNVYDKYIIPHDETCITLVILNQEEKDSNFKSGMYICPPSKKIYDIHFTHQLLYIDISLHPGVFFSLFGIPINNLMNEIYHINDLSLKIDYSILDKMYDAKKDKYLILKYLNEYLYKILSKKDINNDNILNNILSLNTATNLELFYNNSNLSVRQLQRKVKEYTGVNPNSIIRINRFYKVLKYLKYNKEQLDLTQIALNYGFYDQSHMIKEFKYFTGKTPKNFIINTHKYLQYKCNYFC